LVYYDPKLKKKRIPNKERIYAYIKNHPDTTQPKIQKEFRMKPNCVSPRVKELKDEGRIIVSGTIHEELADGHLVEKYRVVTA
jgi:predicted transcriptional regulator